MASHRHHHEHHHHQRTTSCCSTCSCSQFCQPPAPAPQQSDPLLQALASLLLQSQSQPQENYYLNETHFLKTFKDQNFVCKKHHFNPRKQQQYHEEPNFLIISSLVSRINALESSVQHFSKTSNSYSYPSFSLKDAAARVIQTHFRAFLVHRSRTLRQLKDLAFIKSSLNSLKLSISSKPHFDYVAVSQKAMDLLLKLDSFQGGADPLIKDGKRSVRRDLHKFLEYIDGLAVKRHKHLYKNAKNVRVLSNGDKARILRSNPEEIMEKLREEVENLERFSRNEEVDDDDVELEGFHQIIGEREKNSRISIAEKAGVSATQSRNGGVLVKRQGSQPRVKKTVSFAENGNVYKIISTGNEVSSSADDSLTDESVSSDDHGDIVENQHPIKESRRLVENEEENNSDNEEAFLGVDGEKITRRGLSSRQGSRSEIEGDYQLIQNGDFVFSAPLPVKMESKADLMKKRKGALQIGS